MDKIGASEVIVDDAKEPCQEIKTYDMKEHVRERERERESVWTRLVQARQQDTQSVRATDKIGVNKAMID